ncbi:MAG: helix-turn-helix transcriptional regulator [Gemmatimonadaceae bacterium]|nr:helix-turn-helix transcriptional regulator [Gemmatimonadaceae bacterium]
MREEHVHVTSDVTPRETEIIDQLVRGWTAREIASDLRISHHTVRTHIRNIYEKLGLGNRIDLLRWRESLRTSERVWFSS